MTECYVISLKHTGRADKSITLWRPENRGYCWRLGHAGRYPSELVLKKLSYYNNGITTLAVPTELVDDLSLIEEGVLGLRNDGYTWEKLIAGAIRQPENKPRPQCRFNRKKGKEVCSA